jgi:diaminohydroxyphosphoribosylaminopyrimidine deaminase / 5-amino-6-(5-phosphoribosylamino)uracil reductase
VNDQEAVLRACALARRGTFDVEPNPVVGAVVLRDGALVAEGWHRAFGGPHAEIDALARAGTRARGATVAITLEPCSSTGKTGPCTAALLAAGVARVVVGCADPDPRHQGRGLEQLLAAGVHVDLLELPEARALLGRFRGALVRRRPHVLAKWAMTRDGAIAPAGGGRARISCRQSLDHVHRWRAHVDALVVGVNTVIADDPLLTARGVLRPTRPLRRVVLDPSLRIPFGCRLIATADETPTWVFCTEDADSAVEAALLAEGVSVFRVPRGPQGNNGPEWLAGVFAALGTQGCQRVLVEGGGHTLATCLAADLVDQVAIFMAPHELGRDERGRGGLAAVEGLTLASLSPHEVARALGLSDCRVSRSGTDTLLRGFRR